MKLLYLYIRSYEKIFQDKEINFSSDFKVSFSNGILDVKNFPDKAKGYYGKHVDNITLFLGKNGTGKSTILDILGMNRFDTAEDSERHNGSYFALYHLYDDFYATELTDKSFLEGKQRIKNISLGDRTPDAVMYHFHMGIIIRFDSKSRYWFYEGNIIQNWLNDHENNSRMEYHYILTAKTIRAVSTRDSNHGYLFSRRYYFNKSVYKYLFRHFDTLSSMDTFMTDSYELTFTDEASNNALIGSSMKENTPEGFIEKCKNEVKELFITGVFNEDGLPFHEKMKKAIDRQDTPAAFKGSGTKNEFIYYLCARAAVFYFFYHFIQDDWIRNTDKASYPENEIEKEIEKFIAETGKDSFMAGDFQLLEDFRAEYVLLRYMIDKYCPAGTIEGAGNLLSYVLGRYNTADFEDYDIKAMFMAMIESLKSLPESFFKSWKEMKISCLSSLSQHEITETENFLENYGRCEEYHHLLGRILSVQLPGTSHGQAEFLGIMSRAACALYDAGNEDNIILLLDEPDQSMHPEMSRLFMNKFLEIINRIAKCQVQIIMSSHSPFIVTDIFAEGVYQLENSDDGIKITHPEGTFAANIYTILMRPFMLGSTFGEYSRKKITEFLKRLSNDDNIPGDELERIYAVISRVGEPVLKNKLLEKYYGSNRKKKLIHKIDITELDDETLNKIEAILRDNTNVQNRDN